jgi:uncharacterized protein YfaS (alpha-2-macroglobulin family)
MKLHAMWMAAALLAAAPAGAQVVSGSVTNSLNGSPVPRASVTVTDEEGVTVASTTVNEDGRFTVHLEEGGRYVLRISEAGFRESARPFRVEDNGTFTTRVRLHEVVNALDRDAARRQGEFRDTRPVPRPTVRPRPNQD